MTPATIRDDVEQLRQAHPGLRGPLTFDGVAAAVRDDVGGAAEYRCVSAAGRVLAVVTAAAPDPTLAIVLGVFLARVDPVAGRPVLTCLRGADRPARDRRTRPPSLTLTRGHASVRAVRRTVAGTPGGAA